jgi:hypothetical protein
MNFTLDWGKFAADFRMELPSAYQRQSSGIWYFGGPSGEEVKILFEEFESGGGVKDFLIGRKIEPWQVKSVLQFVLENAPEQMKPLFKWLDEGLTVEQILEFKPAFTREYVEEALGHVQRSLIVVLPIL